MIKYCDIGIENNKHIEQYVQIFKEVCFNGEYIYGPYIEKFEKQFAAYCGAKYCVALNSGTSALKIALLSLNRIYKKKLSVAIPNVSFIATLNAVTETGNTPVFIDTDNSGLMNDLLLDGSNIDAVMPVHLYGQNCYIEDMVRYCNKKNLLLIEDACQAHGYKRNGKALGAFGDVGCFSFHPTKNLGSLGDAGAIITDRLDIYEFAILYRTHGGIVNYEHAFVGDTMRMSSIQAGILSYKLNFLDGYIQERKKIASNYKNQLAGVQKITLPREDSVWYIFPILCSSRVDRDALRYYLDSYGIETRVHYPRLLGEYFKNNFSTVNAKMFIERELSLPIYPGLSGDDINFICERIRYYES